MSLDHSTQEISAKTVIIELEGDIDFSVSQKLKEQLASIIDKGKHNLILDLGKIRYIDSSGLEAMTSTQTKANLKGGDIYIVCKDPSIKKIFDITGLDEYIKFFDSPEKAMAAVSD